MSHFRSGCSSWTGWGAHGDDFLLVTEKHRGCPQVSPVPGTVRLVPPLGCSGDGGQREQGLWTSPPNPPGSTASELALSGPSAGPGSKPERHFFSEGLRPWSHRQDSSLCTATASPLPWAGSPWALPPNIEGH